MLPPLSADAADRLLRLYERRSLRELVCVGQVIAIAAIDAGFTSQEVEDLLNRHWWPFALDHRAEEIEAVRASLFGSGAVDRKAA